MSALLAVATVALAFAPAVRADSGVFVNGQPLEDVKRQKMERAYGVPILPGRYWYDPVSGAWGMEGGPTIGQIHPNMAIGGALRADASKGRSGVFVNGRQLHELDVSALKRCMPLAPGRYWVRADGVGGREGKPASFNLKQLCGDDKGMRNGDAGRPGAHCDEHRRDGFACANARSSIGVVGKDSGKTGVFADGRRVSTAT